jgi:hypothetical protein
MTTSRAPRLAASPIRRSILTCHADSEVTASIGY